MVLPVDPPEGCQFDVVESALGTATPDQLAVEPTDGSVGSRQTAPPKPPRGVALGTSTRSVGLIVRRQ
jgi:hypothetical protein